MMIAHQIWYHPNDFEIETDDMNNTKQKKEEHTKNKIMDIKTVDTLFLSNHNIHKSSHGLCFWASDTLIDRF